MLSEGLKPFNTGLNQWCLVTSETATPSGEPLGRISRDIEAFTATSPATHILVADPFGPYSQAVAAGYSNELMPDINMPTSSPYYLYLMDYGSVSPCFYWPDVVLLTSSNTDEGTDTQSQNTAKLIERAVRLEAAREISIEFEKAKEESFEDGMDSEFSRRLENLIIKFDHSALAVIRSLVFVADFYGEAVGEALRLLGRIDHPETYSNRLVLLEQCLFHPDARVRDAASLGLAYLDNPSAIPYLRRAIQVEPNEMLLEDMEQVLRQLEETLQCLSS